MPRSSRSFDDTDDNDRGNWSVNNSLSVPILSEEETESESTELENQRSSSEYARFFSNNLGQTPNGYTLTPFTRSPVCPTARERPFLITHCRSNFLENVFVRVL